MPEPAIEAWDLFISHASEDKIDFVEPLASALSAFGVRVWYDNYELKLGDSLSRTIDAGLAKSDYGLVVLSPAFIAKKWPEYELRGLTAREIAGGKVILPVWHNVTQAEILKFSPPLADKLAVLTSESTPLEIAVRIIEAIRPDIFTQILRRLAHYQSFEGAETKLVSLAELKPAPIRHEELPPDLVGRVRLVRAALLGVYTHSMEFWLDGFKRDSHPSKEVEYWEHIAAVYQEYVAMAPVAMTPEQHKKLLELIFALSAQFDQSEIEKRAGALPDGALETVINLYGHSVPPYDIEEDLPFSREDQPEDVKEMFENLDIEHFPHDLPENLIRDLMGTQDKKPKKQSP